MLSEVRGRLGRRAPRRVHEPDAWQAAVAMILVSSSEADLQLLFIKRADRTGDPWSGQMGLPGGRRDESDAALLETARRETREETGIDLPPDALLGELDDLHPSTKVLPNVVVRPFVFGLGSRPEIQPNHEVADHVWVSLRTLAESASRVEVEVRGQPRTVDAFVVGEHVIWGMTHRIVTPFLAIMG